MNCDPVKLMPVAIPELRKGSIWPKILSTGLRIISFWLCFNPYSTSIGFINYVYLHVIEVTDSCFKRFFLFWVGRLLWEEIDYEAFIYFRIP